MKKKSILCLFSVAVLMLSACGAAEENNTAGDESETSSTVSSTDNIMSDNEEDLAESIENNEEDIADSADSGEARQISVQFGENTVLYELNDSTAADFLYEQLPITTEVENYSTNEKIFYPSRELDTSDSPVAEGGAEQISEMSGTIVIDIAD